MKGNSIKAAQLKWDEQNTPYSDTFNDHYYSRMNGLQETHHVFIEGNQLISRWQQLSDNQSFCIMETGFGSGLNFIASWQLWNQYNPGKNNLLHFISFEAYPMTELQLKQSLKHWEAELPGYPDRLLEKYPPLSAGIHDLFFEEDNVRLTLVLGDIREQLPEIESAEQGLADAWFLDGFAPSRNPEMWQPDLYQQMLRLSKPDVTVATYSVAGVVRNGLKDAGFIIERRPGFATKREMLTAHLP